MVQRLRPGLTGRRRYACTILTLIMLVSTGPPVNRATAARQDDPAFTPASEHVQVVAQGVVDLSSEDLGWRIVRYSAAPEAEADFVAWPLGFVLATTAPLLLTDQDTGDQIRLGPGEATLVRDGTEQRRSGFGATATSYLAIELVPASEAEARSEGAVLQPWSATIADPGLHDIDLVRSVLIGDEQALIPDSGATNLLLATEGLLVAGPPGEEGRNLLSGEALTFDGDLEIRQPAGEGAAAGASSAFVAAIIGPSVAATGATAAATARPAGAGGTIAIAVFNCPAGATPETFDPAACSPASGAFDVVISSDTAGVTLTRADSTADEGVYTWDELPFGDYRVIEVVLPPGYATYTLTSERPVGGDPDVGYTVTLDESSPDTALDVYNFPPS